MKLFTVALNELGRHVLEHYGGRYEAVVRASRFSAVRLAELLTEMSFFQDVARYGDLTVHFYKRAQLAAADLSDAFGKMGLGRFPDLDKLTMFADNLVPHVLRVDGLLVYEAWLCERIDRQVPIPAGSYEEIEIRACAVHCVELLKAAIAAAGDAVSSVQLDRLLWTRGQGRSYKAIPRHRTRTIYY